MGGADNVDASVFAPFDYVALGHIHGPQNVGGERIRYCGTPRAAPGAQIVIVQRHQIGIDGAQLSHGVVNIVLIGTMSEEQRRYLTELLETIQEERA
mgnify:CR=1 FL=1